MTAGSSGRAESLRDRRFAANQTVFRRANERLSRRLPASAPRLVPYVCECGDEACLEVVMLRAEEYEHVRSSSVWFLIALGHQILPDGAERILETHESHHVVEKSGAAGVLADTLSTRRPGDGA